MSSVNAAIKMNNLVLDKNNGTSDVTMKVDNNEFQMKMGNDVLMTVAPDAEDEVSLTESQATSKLTISKETVFENDVTFKGNVTNQVLLNQVLLLLYKHDLYRGWVRMTLNPATATSATAGDHRGWVKVDGSGVYWILDNVLSTPGFPPEHYSANEEGVTEVSNIGGTAAATAVSYTFTNGTDVSEGGIINGVQFSHGWTV